MKERTALNDSDRDVLDAWGIGPVVAARAPANGTINRTLLLDTPHASYALRAYRHPERAPVEREHAVIAYACARGLPAVAPLALPDGATILEREGRFYALFPRAPGSQFEPDALGAAELVAMGRCLAALHRGLRDYPAERARRRSFAVDGDHVLGRIAALDQVIRGRSNLDDVDRRALRSLAGRREWIARHGASNPGGLAELEQQLIHGDYLPDNLFFERGEVSAIIDWDQTYLAPRAWEIARAMHLIWNFAAQPCRAFLAAYCAALPLSDAELDLPATHYSWFRAHDLWLYEAIYQESNDRLRIFVESDGFVPLIDRWAMLRAVL
ncbi:MAG TPA: phosphotransferase [Roseiflexaceae bacterium]|nr:phosphotransferase [Roseiflexaceae bacterium]